jgi:IS5 family transposase
MVSGVHQKRQKLTRQMSIFSVTMRHYIGKELAAFSEILDTTSKRLDLMYADLTRAARKDTGREGMTAEQGTALCCSETVP